MGSYHGLAVVGSVWYLAIASISTGGWLCILLVYNRASPRRDSPRRGGHGSDDGPHESSELAPTSADSLGVSILRPMSGLDPDLHACLTSSFRQDYGGPFEVILSVKSPADPAVTVANRVIAENPSVDARLIIGDLEVGVNPKVNNLIRSYEQSKYPYIWILDSNSWTSTNTLNSSMRHFARSNVNLVHHLPVAHALGQAELGARLDDVYMGTMHAKMYAIINFLCVAPCVMGKSNIIRKSALPEDGLRGFGRFIAEDHLLAVSIWRGRATHVLGTDCVRQPLLEVSGLQYCLRRIRWVRVRKYMTVAATLVEPFTEAFMMGFIGSSSIAKLCGWFVWWKLWIIHILLWMTMDYICWSRLRNHPHDEYPSFSPDAGSSMRMHTWITVWFIREISAFPLWCIAMSRDRIYWRGSSFVINRDMTARRVED